MFAAEVVAGLENILLNLSFILSDQYTVWEGKKYSQYTISVFLQVANVCLITKRWVTETITSSTKAWHGLGRTAS